jgi:hypothetical protein
MPARNINKVRCFKEYTRASKRKTPMAWWKPLINFRGFFYSQFANQIKKGFDTGISKPLRTELK